MHSDDAPGPEALRIRVTLELSRSDDPLLFDELVQLKKGRRRVGRLRVLAHDGLLAAQHQPPGFTPAGPEGALVDAIDDRGEQAELAPLDPRVTASLFDAPLQE